MQIAVYSKLNQGSISFFEMSISFMRQKIEKSPSTLSDYLFFIDKLSVDLYSLPILYSMSTVL